MVEEPQELLSGELLLLAIQLHPVTEGCRQLVEESGEGLGAREVLQLKELFLPLRESVGLEFAHALQIVAVAGEALVRGNFCEVPVGNLHDLQVEEEELPPHEVAELGGALGELLVIVVLRVGGEEEMGVELGRYEDFREGLVASEGLPKPRCIEGGDLP